MPHTLSTKTIKGKKFYLIKNKDTGKIVKYRSKKARDNGMRIREAITHGWKPTKKR